MVRLMLRTTPSRNGVLTIYCNPSLAGDVWKPLRKIDCKALNESRGKLPYLFILPPFAFCFVKTKSPKLYRRGSADRGRKSHGRSQERNNSIQFRQPSSNQINACYMVYTGRKEFQRVCLLQHENIGCNAI